MGLSDTKCRQVKYSGTGPGDKHTDGDGLYLLVTAAGKYWRMNYRFEGKQKTMAFGVYPEVGLAEARKRRAEAKEQLAARIDPGAAKKEAKVEEVRAAGTTFQAVADEWLERSGKKRAEITQARVVSWFNRDAYPKIGHMPIDQVKPRHIIEVIGVLEARDAIDSAHRVRGYLRQVFEYAMAKELVDRDPTIGVGATMLPKQSSNYAAIVDPGGAGALLRAIEKYDGHPACSGALKIAPYVFVRPGELRFMEWSEIDWKGRAWNIPGPKMKMKKPHVVPLADQVVALLEQQKAKTGHCQYVFPSLTSGKRPMSDNTVNKALRSMGYPRDVMTGHGFRAMARTMMDEQLGERVDLIEHQLAHEVKDVHGRAYNRTAHLEARRGMMQRWADYLDTLRRGAEVVKLRG